MPGHAESVSLPSGPLKSLLRPVQLAIPRDGLVLRGNNIFVMRVNNDNTVEKVAVETGIGLGGFVEVIGNVDKGDRIITRGGERLQAGQAVTIADS